MAEEAQNETMEETFETRASVDLETGEKIDLGTGAKPQVPTIGITGGSRNEDDPTGQYGILRVPADIEPGVLRILAVLQEDIFSAMKRRSLYDCDRLELAKKIYRAATTE